MPDKKLTDNEIVKALECCSVQGHFVCNECPAFVNSKCTGTHKAVLDLINRQKAEIERLKPFEDKIAEFNSHIRVEDMLVFASSLEEWLEFMQKTKAEAYKEFAEMAIDRVEKAKAKYQRLCKEQGEKMDDYMHIHFNGITKIINNLLKELVGDNNAGN